MEMLDDVLEFLEVRNNRPNLENLVYLVNSYLHKVPWETVSRILRYHSRPAETCPRSLEEFWRDAIIFGCGGTCYDSNRAFFQLLRHIGYDGYLTIGRVDGEPYGSHSSVVVQIGNKKWLVDIGYPLYTILVIEEDGVPEAISPIYSFRLTPIGNKAYIVTQHGCERDGRCFTFFDEPVTEETFQKYEVFTYQAGINLDTVRISKLSDDSLLFYKYGKGIKVISPDGVRRITLSDNFAKDLGIIFGMNENKIREAHKLIDR